MFLRHTEKPLCSDIKQKHWPFIMWQMKRMGNKQGENYPDLNSKRFLQRRFLFKSLINIDPFAHNLAALGIHFSCVGRVCMLLVFPDIWYEYFHFRDSKWWNFVFFKFCFSFHVLVAVSLHFSYSFCHILLPFCCHYLKYIKRVNILHVGDWSSGSKCSIYLEALLWCSTT